MKTKAFSLARLAALLAFCAFFAFGCTRNMPPNLTPQATVAWKSNEIQKDLDILRNIAEDASAQTPPIIPVATAARVVQYHASSIQVIHAGGLGWPAAVLAGLDQLKKSLSASEQQQLGPYLNLVATVLKAVKP